MVNEDLAICWFRRDLRLTDNPALCNASLHKAVLPIYILDTKNANSYMPGGASRWWLHRSLEALNESLEGHLSIYEGDPLEVLQDLCQRLSSKAVYWNRLYEPWAMARDTAIKSALQDNEIHVTTTNGSLLWEPRDIRKDDGTAYKVFTPFYRKGCLRLASPREPMKQPTFDELIRDDSNSRLDIHDLELLPKVAWSQKLDGHWDAGEENAAERLDAFLTVGLPQYKEGRNFPNKPAVSRLSPYMQMGILSPNQLWYGARKLGDDKNIDHFCSELGWREFAYNQLYHNPDLPIKNLQAKFDAFPWILKGEYLEAWQKGQTGIPFVDAGMRELWQTGFMHNRVRMVTGSFLVKNLRVHWHHGERWFWDTLIDADLASNSASWQWLAGCGADAAPYFRIFNPVLQGKNFDPDGDYIREFVPELANLPNRFLYSPWEAGEETLQGAGVTLGVSYPNPIIDLKDSRDRALAAFQSLKTSA